MPAVRRLARPRVALPALAVLQALGTLALALSATHNGWLWYQGGDQLWFATSAWLLSDLVLAPAEVGYGWPVALAPVLGLFGPTFVDALPPLVLVNVLVVAPLGLLGVYALAARIAGRLFGLWTAALWVAAPFLAIPLFVERYHERYVDQLLPQALGLTAMADFPSMVLVALAAALVLRSLDADGVPFAVLGGLLAGLAFGMKPPNALFLAGALLAYLVAWRLRPALAFGLALVPAALALAVWKQRGLGTLPLLAYDEVRLAAAPTLLAVEGLGDRVQIDLDQWRHNMALLREYFYSVRLVQWLPIAGVVAVARVSRPGAALLFGWLGAFLLVKGTSPLASVDDGSFFRLLMQAWPAYLVLAAAVPLLFPTALRRLGRRLDPVPWARAPGPRTLAAGAAVLAVVPLLAVAVVRPLDGPERAVMIDDIENVLLIPVDERLELRVAAAGGANELTWTERDWGADVFYRVYRYDGSGADVECEEQGVARCTLEGNVVATTRAPRWLDPEPPEGSVYRVGVVANWSDDDARGDVFALTRAAAPA